MCSGSAESSSGTSSCSLPPGVFNDIGDLFDGDKSVCEICDIANNLSFDEKFAMLYNHIGPPAVFPSTFSHGCQRRFNHSWLFFVAHALFFFQIA